ncbi:P-loop containing nucleoside triphosphate hydrolases superfamily protein [Striga hermonthica]|uniref:P-loop containing nucleoside triphosphate hydrolases superfamily protein n=1 Tax=Striga hermonthica TaxID=68872 RepID=A0A9N7RLN9_STRHE|nr:P-loop containing nucleoside triphosphate hydrolases superfamily protein [Striga hermonthica]
MLRLLSIDRNLCVAAAYIPVQEFLEEESKGLVCDPVDAVPKLRPLKLDDFIHSKAKVRPSVSYDSTSLKELQDWNDQYGGGEGTNKACLKNLATNSYERSFISGLVRPDEIGVEFKDVGALEDPCKGMLLFGPPGTGKTLIAKALATEARAHFINVTPSSLGSMWYGEAEKLTKALFTLAVKLAPTIIFLDEIDALLGARGGYENEATRKVRNEFMSAWDGLTSNDSQRILVLGASNRPFDLDDAVIRRMPRRIHVDLPDVKNRLKILEILLAKEALESGFDIKKLAEATEGYSGSDLKNLCVAAAYKPVQELLEQERKGKKKDGAPALRPLKLDDFINSKATVGPSVAYESSSVVELREWNEQFGEGGSRKKSKIFQTSNGGFKFHS